MARPHAAVEQRRGETPVHRSGWIEMLAGRHQRDEHTAFLCFSHVIAQRPGDGVERQFAACEAADKLKTRHFFPLRFTHSAIGLRGHESPLLGFGFRLVVDRARVRMAEGGRP
jgi:hypothetical protein